MSYIDIIVWVTLLIAVVMGWRRGFFVEVGTLVGIAVGLYAAAVYGESLGLFLGLAPSYATIVGFVLVLILAMIGVGLLGKLLRKLFRSTGFGVLDIILGILLSCFKYMLILSVVFSIVDEMNRRTHFITDRALASSAMWQPVIGVKNLFLPMLDWAGEQVEGLEIETKTEEVEWISI